MGIFRKMIFKSCFTLQKKQAIIEEKDPAGADLCSVPAGICISYSVKKNQTLSDPRKPLTA